MRTALVLLGIVLWPVIACAQLQTIVVEYTDRGTAARRLRGGEKGPKWKTAGCTGRS